MSSSIFARLSLGSGKNGRRPAPASHQSQLQILEQARQQVDMRYQGFPCAIPLSRNVRYLRG